MASWVMSCWPGVVSIISKYVPGCDRDEMVWEWMVMISGLLAEGASVWIGEGARLWSGPSSTEEYPADGNGSVSSYGDAPMVQSIGRSGRTAPGCRYVFGDG